MKKLFSILVFLFIVLIFISGCGPSSLIVSTRPVAPVYARPAAPGVGYVWVQGEWVRSGHGYIYKQGYWAAPRARYHQYIPGHWQRRRHGWFWVPGHWARR
jgi:WXXGXW repeat (2 copies)